MTKYPVIGYPNVLGMIMAGGQGSRLHPLTSERAKPAVPFAGKYRIVDFVLNNFINSGIFKLKVLTQFKSDSLIKHLTSGWNLNRMLGQYVDPVPAQMRTGARWYQGTADAVFQNINLIEDENPDYVAVFGADHIYKMDVSQMLNFHRQVGSVATIAAIPRPIEEASSFGVIEVDESGRMIDFQEKPETPRHMPGRPDLALASMGNYIFDRKFLVTELYSDARIQQSSHDFGKDIIPRIFRDNPVYVYDFGTNKIPGEEKKEIPYWEDVGTIEAYYRANLSMRDVLPPINLYNDDWPIRTAPGQSAPAKFVFSGHERDGRVGNAVDSIVAGGCIISGGTVQGSVLSRNVRVNSHAHVEDSILFHDVEIGRGAQLRNTIVDRGFRVEAGDRIGFDPEQDAKRFTVTRTGIVILASPSKNLQI